MVMDDLKNGDYTFINFFTNNSATNNIPRQTLLCEVTYGEQVT